ncbi:MAG: type II 3-dehydroquinate dehydratase [Candidatus Izemoplasmatales bacterium]|jgi:3-dehydroquinate dehydratase-2
MNILVVNGPNLNLLGIREPNVYGNKTYQDLVEYLLGFAKSKQIYLEIYQTNYEGEIIDLIQNKYSQFDALIINPGALTHYSYAIYDCLLSVPLKSVEVHISDISTREEFRKKSVIKAACDKQITGYGFDSYIKAMEYLMGED